MPLDAVTLSALVDELQALVDARLDKIHQPAKYELILSLRGGSGNRRLLLSANPARSRLHLTEQARENPDVPPMFCMLLRKHLSGGRLAALAQEPMERVVRLTFDTTTEIGEPARRVLVLECLGRQSNLILLDQEERILESLHRVEADVSSDRRQLLPGLFYRLPPPQEKRSPLETSADELRTLLSAAPPEAGVADWILSRFGGLSPLLCRELAFRAGDSTDVRLCEINAEALVREWTDFTDHVKQKRLSPNLLFRDGKPMDFSCVPILQYGPGGQPKRLPSFSALLEAFYGARDQQEQMRLRGAQLLRTATTARERTARKLLLQEKELSDALGRDDFRKSGDLITANLHRLERGMSQLVTEDFYDPDLKEISVTLDPLLNPQQNAARYYKKYNKAKNAEEILNREIARGREELKYLDSVVQLVSQAEREEDLRELRGELAEAGYLKQAEKKGKKKQPQAAFRPMEFYSSAGIPILVGRNNIQNDTLTLRTARKDELWLHTQKLPGSHVILRTEGRQPDEESVLQAALLAAYYSKGREGQNVPVDCALVRHVKKPNGARPGMVIYTDYRTLYVTPEEGAVQRLREKR